MKYVNYLFSANGGARVWLALSLLTLVLQGAAAQQAAADSVRQHVRGNRLSVGGYGEVALSRHFYSDNQYRYRNPAKYRDDHSNGRFDIPHAVIYLGYDFGKGWTMGTEVEFEHTGTGSAIEVETDEGGEFEHEIEKGGEVALEQLWLQKSFSRAANVRVGHIIVPVGLNNARHEPLNFFTVYRPEGENTILPSTWHDTGVSFWGKAGQFRYEVMMVAGLNALQYSRDNWIKGGNKSAFEFKPANKYGFAARLDYTPMPGLRIGLSGYYGQGMHNTSPNEMEGDGKTYDKVRANTIVGSVDITLKRWNWIVRGQADYGYVSDTPLLNQAKINQRGTSPYNKTYVGKNAYAVGLEAGYDVFSQIPVLRRHNHKLYVFGRCEQYNSYLPEATQSKATNNYTKRTNIVCGLNYHPIPQIAIKMDYALRCLTAPCNNEPSLNFGVAYEGFFL